MAEKTTTGRLVAAIGGLVLIISLFLKWAGVDVPDAPEASGQFGQFAEEFSDRLSDLATFSGWQVLDIADIVFFVVGVLAIAPAAFDIFDLEIELPFDVGLVALVGGVVATLWIILRVVDIGDGLEIKFGIFVGLAGAIAVAVGGFLQQSDSGGEEYAFEAPGQVPPQAPPAPGVPPQAPPPAAAPPQQPQPPQAPPPPPAV